MRALGYSTDPDDGGDDVTLKHPKARTRDAEHLAVAPHFSLETQTIPRHVAAGRRDAAGRRVPDHPRRADARRQRAPERRDVRLDLDGAPGREAHGRVLRQEHDRQGRVSADRGDRDALRQHPRRTSGTRPTRTRRRAARPPARARRRCSAVSRSSAAGRSAARAEGKPADKPNLVMGINVQVCWEKFANYWDVEMRLVPMEGDRFNLSAEEAVSSATRTRSGSSRSSARRSTARTSPCRRSATRSTRSSARRASTSPCTSTAPRAP